MDIKTYLIVVGIGLVFIILSKLIGLIFVNALAFNRKVYDLIWKDRPFKYPDYNPDEDYGKPMIIFGVGIIVLATICMIAYTLLS